MAKYTTQVRSLIESGYPLFDFTYPIFDLAYKPVLEQKIIDHYYFREIGFETVAQFKHFLREKLNRIMPYYNEHYLALEVFKTFDPYINKDLTTTESRTRDETTDTRIDTTNDVTGKVIEGVHAENTTTRDGLNTETLDGREVFSDTPQAKLSGLDYATNLTDNDNTTTTNIDESQTNIGDSDSTTDTTQGVIGSEISGGTTHTTDDYLHTIKGFDGMKYASEVYQGVRDVIMNIDQLIIDELKDLFMTVY